MSTHDQINKRFNNSKLAVNGDRRKEPNRRRFTYTDHTPERRSGIDRRGGKDRRKEVRFRKTAELKYIRINSSN